MSSRERREEILRRLDRDPIAQLVLARRVATRPKTVARPAIPEGTKPEIIVGEISRLTSATIDSLTTPIEGRLVRAGEANLNGAYFAPEDLEYGLPSMAGAPLTWNHVSELGGYGWIETASLVESPDFGLHAWITGRVWTGRFPEIAVSLQQSLDSNTASLSMECMASAVGCMAEGCGCVATDAENACEHILNHTALRQMIKPTFFGAGLILDGVKPGWPGASLNRR